MLSEASGDIIIYRYVGPFDRNGAHDSICHLVVIASLLDDHSICDYDGCRAALSFIKTNIVVSLHPY